MAVDNYSSQLKKKKEKGTAPSLLSKGDGKEVGRTQKEPASPCLKLIQQKERFQSLSMFLTTFMKHGDFKF